MATRKPRSKSEHEKEVQSEESTENIKQEKTKAGKAAKADTAKAETVKAEEIKNGSDKDAQKAETPPITDTDPSEEEARASVEPEDEGPCGSSLGKGKRACAEFFQAFKGEGFFAALSFLSRLGPARILNQEQMRGSVFFFPLVGALIALIAAIPAWILPSGQLWIKAWLFSLIILWLTRGLHWDGLADLADALGSNRSGAEFQAVLKDSRSGVFAILTVIFGVLGYVFAVHGLLLKGYCLPLILVPAFARCAPMFIGNLSRPNEKSTLGQYLHEAVGLKIGFIWVAALAIIGILGGYFLGVLLTLFLAAIVLYGLLNTAERHDGYNGDFLGASIILVEVGGLLMFALV